MMLWLMPPWSVCVMQKPAQSHNEEMSTLCLVEPLQVTPFLNWAECLTTAVSLPAGCWRPFKQMDSGSATGFSLPRLVCHLSVLLYPHRVQRLHLCQPPHVPRHPLISPLLFCFFPWLMEESSPGFHFLGALEPSPTFNFFHIEK